MRRFALAVAAAALLLAAPVWAVSEKPTVWQFPMAPPDPSLGAVQVIVAVHNGDEWVIVNGSTVEPGHDAPECVPSLGPPGDGV